MFQPTDGNNATFNNKPTTASSGTSYWGTLAVKFDTCTTGVMTLNGADGVQNFNISKLAAVTGTACNQDLDSYFKSLVYKLIQKGCYLIVATFFITIVFSFSFKQK